MRQMCFQVYFVEEDGMPNPEEGTTRFVVIDKIENVYQAYLSNNGFCDIGDSALILNPIAYFKIPLFADGILEEFKNKDVVLQ